jgi:hypothetical protein
MMSKAKAIAFAALFSALLIVAADAQEGFGFGGEAEEPGEDIAKTAGGVRLGGSLEIGGALFFDTMDDIGAVSLGDLYSARISIEASGSKVDASIRLKASEELIDERPTDIIEEARLRISSGAFSLEGGLLKLTWGKADSQGPLDVLNPLDLSDLTVTDSLERKIARPMLHATVAIGQSSKAEAVFLPGFEGMRIATEGRWRPGQVDDLKATLNALDAVRMGPPFNLPPVFSGATYASLLDAVDMSVLADSQAGARLTNSAGPLDFGFQYFYGYLFTPAVRFSGTPLPSNVELVYNRYHQVGADFASVIAGFNTRAEVAADLTEDLKGDDPTIYNPSLAFSLGFDRDLFAGVNVNLQYAGTYRLKDGEIDDSAASYDIEKGTDAYSSTLTAVLSQSLLKDALKLKATVLWEIDDKDFLVMPSLAYAVGDAELGLSAGIFAGDEGGSLGQYADSSYVKATLTYEF